VNSSRQPLSSSVQLCVGKTYSIKYAFRDDRPSQHPMFDAGEPYHKRAHESTQMYGFWPGESHEYFIDLAESRIRNRGPCLTSLSGCFRAASSISIVGCAFWAHLALRSRYARGEQKKPDSQIFPAPNHQIYYSFFRESWNQKTREQAEALLQLCIFI
jgi:hypothetical protein